MKHLSYAVLLALGCIGMQPCLGQNLVRVEEDWSLHVLQPDELIDAPQITMTMMPFGGNSSILFQFDINHASMPSFDDGGMQVRIANDDQLITQHRFKESHRLEQDGEVLNWTQIIQTTDSGAYFGVKDASSSSFGNFSGYYVGASDSSMGGRYLNGYDYHDSLENSGVVYASNRVEFLKLKEVRVFYSNGQIVSYTINQDVSQ